MHPDNLTSSSNMIPTAANGANGAVAVHRTDTAPLRRDLSQAVSQVNEHLTQDINLLVAAAGSLGRAELTDAAQRVSAFMAKTSATACDLTAQGKEKAQIAAQRTGAYVKENPLQSLAFALTLGYVFARLTMRR
ncbi:MAG: hypothetical protein LH481_15255 [Burkholderiales bacterium]|nr:hypothetical protein [Burkholderiales bacterium]